MQELKEFKVIKRLTGKNLDFTDKNYIEIDINKPYNITKPIVLCFTGNSGTTLRVANGFAKAISNTVNIKDEVELFSIKYREKNYQGEFEYIDVEKFVDCFFLPLLQKNGKKVSIEQIKKNLRKFTIVTHCYGATFVKNLNSVLQDKMLKLGFKEDKVIDILKSLVHIGYAPHSQNQYNTNFYIKSFDDELMGEIYKIEAEKIINKLPSKEKSKYYLKNSIYLGNGAVFNNENFNLYTENLTGPILKRQDDHMIGAVLKNKDGKLFSSYDNLHSHTASKCFSFIVRKVIENSLKNEQGENIKLNIKEIEAECNQIIEKANLNETEVIKREVLKNSLTTISVEEALKRMQVSEKDFLEGKINTDKIDKSIVGVVDWEGSVYKNLNWVYCNPSVCFREYTQEEIGRAEIMPHKEGIILESGELATLSNEDRIETVNLALLNKGKSLTGSIKYRIMKRNGKSFISLSDNYGSKGDGIEDTFAKQIAIWKKLYNQNTLTTSLTKNQKTVIKNLCTFFGVNPKNIRFLSESTIEI